MTKMIFSCFFILVSLFFASCNGTPYSDKYYSALASQGSTFAAQGSSREDSDENASEAKEGNETETATIDLNSTSAQEDKEPEEPTIIPKEIKEIVSSLLMTPKKESLILDIKKVVKTIDKYTYIVDQYAISDDNTANKPLFHGNQFLGIIQDTSTQDGETTLFVKRATQIQDAYVQVEASFEKEEILTSLARSLGATSVGTYDSYNDKPLQMQVVKSHSIDRSANDGELVLRVQVPQGYRIPIDRSIDYDVTSTNRQEIDLGVDNSTNDYLVVDSDDSYIEFSIDMQTSLDFTTGTKELIFTMKDEGYFISNLEVSLKGEFTQNFSHSLNLFKPIEVVLQNSKTPSIVTKVIFTPDILVHAKGAFDGETTIASQVKARNEISIRYEEDNITTTNDDTLTKIQPEIKVDFAAQSSIFLFPHISREISIEFDKIDEPIRIGEIRSGIKYEANFKGEVDNSFLAKPSEYNNDFDAIDIELMAYSFIDSKFDIYADGRNLYKDIGYNDLYKSKSIPIVDLQISVNGSVFVDQEEAIENVVKISNILASDITQTSMNLVWASSISGSLSVNSYAISYLDKSEDSTNTWSDEIISNINLHRASGLKHTTPYQFRIRAQYSDSSYSEYEHSSIFTTLEGEVVIVPEHTVRDYDQRILAHDRSIQSLVLSVDNKMILTSSNDGVVKLLDIQTGSTLKEFDARSGDMMSAVISKDNDMVITAGEDGAVRVWDVSSETITQTLSAHTDTVTKIILSNDESFVVSAGFDEQIIIWNLDNDTAKKASAAHTDDILDMALSSDDKILASGGEDKVVKIWDIEKMVVIKTLVGHTSRVRQVDISQDGKYIVSNDYNDIKLWDLETGRLLQTLLYHDDIIRSLMISHDGRRIISGSDDGSIFVYHIDNEALLFELDARNDWIMGLDSTDDDKTIVTGSDLGYIKIWQLP